MDNKMSHQSQSSRSAAPHVQHFVNGPATFDSPVTCNGNDFFNGPVVFNAAATLNAPAVVNGPITFYRAVTYEEPATNTGPDSYFNGPVIFNAPAMIRGTITCQGPVVRYGPVRSPLELMPSLSLPSQAPASFGVTKVLMFVSRSSMSHVAIALRQAAPPTV
jgi:hypothetical protein